ncbi:MAG: polysaccharide biosynthesis/export family protein, partial [Bacteroidota bacterium]
IYEVAKYAGPKVTYGDILTINVYSFDPRASQPFNAQVAAGGAGGDDIAAGSMAGGPEYLVDENGTIEFPVLGRIEVEGMTQREIEEMLSKELKGGYIKSPVVDVRLMNFRIVILGEAGSGILDVPNNRINIIEALALAGDISIYGDRKNVLIIREDGDKREFARMDITDAGIFNSPYFNLQNNDIIYLEPVRYKTQDQNQQRLNQSITFGTAMISVFTLLLTIFRTNR